MSTTFRPSTPLAPNPFDSLLPPPVVLTAKRLTNREDWARFKLHLRTLLGRFTPKLEPTIKWESTEETEHSRWLEKPENDDPEAEVNEVILDRDWLKEANVIATPTEDIPVHDPDVERCRPFSSWKQFRLWMNSLAHHCVFISQYTDHSETHYQQESWRHRKPLAIWSSLFFVVNWILGCAFISHPMILMDKIFYFGVAPSLTLPVVFMVLYDCPNQRPHLYQSFLCISTWSWAIYQVLYIFLCGFYDQNFSRFACGDRDFLNVFYYALALPTIATCGLKLKRFPAMIGALTFIVFSCATMFPNNTHWTRNILNFIAYHIILLLFNYSNDKHDRVHYTIWDDLKNRYAEAQAAQTTERQYADSKRRLTSVPLHIAVMAAQNMEASLTVSPAQKVEFDALTGSLTVMSKVLNDVLDFNRMDTGEFESASTSFAFHEVMRSVLVPLRLATDARQLELITDLDYRIDEVARGATYWGIGETPEAIAKHIDGSHSVDGMVFADEKRLKQIITNFASNACKFTPAGGKVTISTRLISPSIPLAADRPKTGLNSDDAGSPEVPSVREEDFSVYDLPKLFPQLPTPLEQIVVRIEVKDTGCGIRPQDMANNKLFSAFNQTELGRTETNTGTGLGLSLVRQIVKFSGGRLGVRSKYGEGSTFWVELPLGVGPKVVFAPPLPEVIPEDFLSIPHPFSDLDVTNPPPSLLPDSHPEALEPLNHNKTGRPTFVLLPSPRYEATEGALLANASEFSSRQHFASFDKQNVSGYSGLPSSTSTVYELGMDVLVVDDDPLTRMLMKRMLTRMGCNVSTAENGQMALGMIFGTTGPDSLAMDDVPILERIPATNAIPNFAVVFLDNQMPILSGEKAVSKLRALGRRDFVVGVTGNALLKDQQKFLDAGADRVLTKPALERNLRRMLVLADERRRLGVEGDTPSVEDHAATQF